MISALLMLVGAALGATTKFCATVDVSYVDMDGTEAATVRWRDGSINQPARSMNFEVTRLTTGPIPLWVPVGSGQLDASGCTPSYLLTNFASVRVQIKSSGVVSSNVIEVRDVPGGSLATALYTFSNPLSLVPTVNLSPLPGNTDDRWSDAALAMYALTMNRAELLSKSFYLYSAQPCPDAAKSISCADEESGSVYLGEVSGRYEAAKRLGFLVAMYKDAGGLGCATAHNSTYDECVTGLDGYSFDPMLLRKAFHAEAACDAIGRYYSAITWNPLTPGAADSCHYRIHAPIDWDLDGLFDRGSLFPLECYGDPYDAPGQNAEPDEGNWLGDMIAQVDGATGDGECAGSKLGRTTSYDWSRLLWSLVADTGFSKLDVWRIWDDADPYSWDTQGLDAADPTKRLCFGAFVLGGLPTLADVRAAELTHLGDGCP